MENCIKNLRSSRIQHLVCAILTVSGLIACGTEKKSDSDVFAGPGAQCKDYKFSTLGNSDIETTFGLDSTGRVGGKKKEAKGLPNNESLVSDPLGGSGQVLQVVYPKGSASFSYTEKKGGKVGGSQFVTKEPLQAETMILKYKFLIPQNFDCVKGGKLPGIASNGELMSGGKTPTGDNGYSFRLMWRAGCEGEVYAYIPQEENKHIDGAPGVHINNDFGWSIGRGAFSFVKGKWINVELEVRANTPNQKNGVVKVKLDGKDVYERSDLLMRTTDNLKLGRLFFSTFFGGSKEEAEASKDEKMFFGDMNLCHK